MKLVEIPEHDGVPHGRVVLTVERPYDDPDGMLGLHVYACEGTARKKGVASVDLDLDRAEILLRHLSAWVRRRRGSSDVVPGNISPEHPGACDCGCDDFEVSETLIKCKGCDLLWGLVNGLWVEADPVKIALGRLVREKP